LSGSQPEDFNKRNYVLRPTISHRQTELLIVVTLYNEDETLFCRTIHGIMKNIAQLCKRKKSQTWGDDGWKSESSESSRYRAKKLTFGAPRRRNRRLHRR
jgi:hypothetical protein